MKILVVCQYYYPEQFRIVDICQELSKRGHDVDVLTGIPNYPHGKFFTGYGFFHKRDENINGVNVKRVPIIPRGSGRALLLLINYISYVIGACIWTLLARRRKYDAVFVYQLSPVFMAIPGVLAGKIFKCPLILYVADLWPESIEIAGGVNSGNFYKAISTIVSYIYKNSESVVVSSIGFTKSVHEHGKNLRSISYIPQYPEDVYRPVDVLLDSPLRFEVPTGFNIVFTGNIGVAQGLDIVVQAAKLVCDLKDVNWIIIGDGRARESLQELVRKNELADRVIFLGRKPMEKIPEYLALCDVAFLCLQSGPLLDITLPAKIQSYMACKIPIIGSVGGDAAQVIIDAECGLVGPSGDAVALADNVRSIFAMTCDERRILAANAYYFYEKNFLKKKLIGELELLLSKSINSFNEKGGN